jgi:DNA ligase-4
MTQKDRERAVYGLKEKNLARTYIKLIPLGMRDPDALRLLHWKKPVDRATDGEKSVGGPLAQKSQIVIKHCSGGHP